ncbi:MAG: leucyl aminopeptidase [Parvibaculales bacterium]
MTIAITGNALPKTGTLVITVSNKGLGSQGKELDKALKGQIKKAMKSQDFSGGFKSILSLVAPANSNIEKIILLGTGPLGELTQAACETLGGVGAGAVAKTKGTISVLADFSSQPKCGADEAAAHMAMGSLMRGYRFDKYKSKTKVKVPAQKINFGVDNPNAVKKLFDPLKKVAQGVFLARDLVNEPANILNPPEFAKRARALTKLGVKVEVLSEAKMKQLGMGALLGVGQGSVQPSQLVIMQWQGAAKSKKPVAFVGKGVCFDTGGISIKPSAGMEDMRGDMGGAAAVTGLMHALAARKAKANVIGVIGLVENMPSGNAQRPGDIVTSMSGQTIEVLNTDAEGRLVLADALWYTQKRFKPEFMIDLATLTGAILVALGQEYAGLFSNDDALCAKLDKAGQAENEKVWRMPINDVFDKMIDTPNADMKNIGGRYAGSSTAAQFLQRFTNGVPWAHLDIAGTAMGSPKSPISQSWGSGFGVKLLNRLVKDHYEG